MSCRLPLVPRTARLAPLAWLVIALALAACFHDWDDYEAPGAGDDDDDATTPITCSRLCSAYEACVESDPGCASSCDAQLPSCNPDEQATLDSCVQVLESCSVAAEAGWIACLLGVGCYGQQ